MKALLDNPQYILLLIGAAILHIIIIRQIFSIPKLLKQQQAQTKILALIAKEQGADPKKLKEIIETAEGSAYERNIRELGTKKI